MNEEITVTTVHPSVNKKGFTVETKTEKQVYAEVSSTDYRDFYGSSNETTKASIVFVLRREDFDDLRITVNKKHYYPKYVAWEGAEYELIRWRFNDEHSARLICG